MLSEGLYPKSLGYRRDAGAEDCIPHAPSHVYGGLGTLALTLVNRVA